MEFLGFEIDPDELPFWGEEDLGEDEPRFLEWAAKKLKEFDTVDVINPAKFKQAMKLVGLIISNVKEYCESATYDVYFEPILGRDMVLRIIANTMPFDEDAIANIRNSGGDLINSIDVEGRLDGKAELTIRFKDVKIRALNN